MDTVNMLNTMRFYCQPILPLVYDESMSYYETLCKVVGQLNATGETVNKLNEGLTNEIADRQASDTALDERLKKIEELDKRIHFLVFDGASPNGAMPTRTELWNWVREGDIICALYSANDATRGDVYAASCNYNAGDWASEISSDFHFLIPLETTYDSTGKLAVKQKIVKLTIPSYAKKVLTVPWGEEIIEINTPHTSAEGVVNFTATVVGETVTANITPADFIRLFDAASVTSKLCVGVNARLNYNALELSSSVATVYDNSSAKREVRITFVQDPHAGSRDYVPSEIFDLVNIVGDKDTNTWKVETFGTELFDFQRYEGFRFTRKAGNVIEAVSDESDPASVEQYYNDLHDKDYQNLPVHLIDEVDNADYWNGTFDSYDDGHITFTFITSNYATIGKKMVVRVIELSAAKTGSVWVGDEKWSYAAKEFTLPLEDSDKVITYTASNVGEGKYIAGKHIAEYQIDFAEGIPAIIASIEEGNRVIFRVDLKEIDSVTGATPVYFASGYTKVDLSSAVSAYLFAGGILNGQYDLQITSGLEHATLTYYGDTLPMPNPDGSDDGKVPTVVGDKWGLGTGATTVTVQNANLLDSSDTTNQVQGKIFVVNSSSAALISANSDTAIYFPVGKWGAGNYKFPIDYAQYGVNAAYKTALFKADKAYLKTNTGVPVDTSDSAAHIVSVTITQADIDSGAYYIGLSIRTRQLGTSAMVVKDMDYPASYIKYGTTTYKVQKLDNGLTGKKASFCGDSLCAGTSVGTASPIYGQGWAGIIGKKNAMTWQNLGVNGATVAETAASTGTMIIVNQLAKAYPDADYIIIDGGCNDFDQMSGATTETTMGGITATWDDSYIKTTFAGALEHLFYEAVTKHPKAKIGYIIPPLMGLRNWTQYETISYRVYFNLAIDICKKWGIPYLDLWYNSPLNPNLTVYYDPSLGTDGNIADASKCYVDGQHLTTTGYELIAPQIEAWMRTL